MNDRHNNAQCERLRVVARSGDSSRRISDEILSLMPAGRQNSILRLGNALLKLLTS
jgi:hypothetical protein